MAGVYGADALPLGLYGELLALFGARSLVTNESCAGKGDVADTIRCSLLTFCFEKKKEKKKECVSVGFCRVRFLLCVSVSTSICFFCLFLNVSFRVCLLLCFYIVQFGVSLSVSLCRRLPACR